MRDLLYVLCTYLLNFQAHVRNFLGFRLFKLNA